MPLNSSEGQFQLKIASTRCTNTHSHTQSFPHIPGQRIAKRLVYFAALMASSQNERARERERERERASVDPEVRVDRFQKICLPRASRLNARRSHRLLQNRHRQFGESTRSSLRGEVQGRCSVQTGLLRRSPTVTGTLWKEESLFSVVGFEPITSGSLVHPLNQ